MSISTVQLQQPLEAIIFDCDGTLSLIEGIDELARQNGVSAPVESLTAMAMGATGINPQLYRDRLQLVKPFRAQVLAIGREYYQQQMPDTREVIQILQRLGKAVYLISAGLLPAVKIFGGLLQIPEKNIFAVEVEFDQAGNYVDYDHTSPMTRADGKRFLVTEIKKTYPRIAFIGDGLNDLAACDLVTRFVGMGGAFYRQNIADKCEFYVNEKSLTPLLPLVLTAEEMSRLTLEEKKFYQKGMDSLTAGKVKFVT